MVPRNCEGTGQAKMSEEEVFKRVVALADFASSQGFRAYVLICEDGVPLVHVVGRSWLEDLVYDLRCEGYTAKLFRPQSQLPLLQIKRKWGRRRG